MMIIAECFREENGILLVKGERYRGKCAENDADYTFVMGVLKNGKVERAWLAKFLRAEDCRKCLEVLPVKEYNFVLR